LVAAGNLSNKSAETSLSLSGKIDTLEKLYNLPVYKNGDMVKTVGDISKIQKSYKKASSLSRLNSESSVTLSVKKRSGENVLATVAKVKAALEAFEKEIPSSVSVTITNDSSDDVKEILRDLQNSVLISVILVFSVILLSLGYKASLLVGLAIPSSFFIGILLISVFGFSINMVVLFGLIMSVGMLVDGAIVVTEYADKLAVRGYNKKNAYKEASRRMFWPIFSSTLTTLAAFVPLIFWEGRIGEFMKYLPITITIVLSVSIFVSLVMLPLLGALLAKDEKSDVKNEKAENNYDTKAFRFYGSILETLIDYRKTTIFTLILVMVLILKAFPIYGNGVIFFPQQEPESGTILLKSAGNMSLEKKSDIVSQAENLIKDMDAIEFYTTRVLSQGETIGNISMDLLPWGKQPRPKGRGFSCVQTTLD
jgi:multidrug efflux pump